MAEAGTEMTESQAGIAVMVDDFELMRINHESSVVETVIAGVSESNPDLGKFVSEAIAKAGSQGERVRLAQMAHVLHGVLQTSTEVPSKG